MAVSEANHRLQRIPGKCQGVGPWMLMHEVVS